MTIRTRLPLCAGLLLLSGIPADAARHDGFAVVGADGTLASHSANVLLVKHVADSGVYSVLFEKSLSKCVFIASPQTRGFATVEPATAGLHYSIVVNTFDTSGRSADLGFHAIARCGESTTCVISPKFSPHPRLSRC